MAKKNKILKGKMANAFGSVSGVGSIVSAHNVCHSVCLAVVAILSVFGIIVSSNVLMFLEDYNLLFWSMGILFLGVSLLLYLKFGKCISTKMILFNVGLLVIGFPFTLLSQYVFWVLGGTISISSVVWYLKDKWGK
ncbi:MAG: hypothetical protein HYW24_03690 [Candidatus Aenigmarchaeota archaeon]|nr:hypothetical protein [Candidatus Aenigmarchaeota archaeon]